MKKRNYSGVSDQARLPAIITSILYKQVVDIYKQKRFAYIKWFPFC